MAAAETPTVSPSVTASPKSPFIGELSRRESNLMSQIEELRNRQPDLEAERREIDNESRTLSDREAELAQTEAALALQEAQIATIPDLTRTTAELEQRSAILRKTLTGLTSQLSAVQSDIAGIRAVSSENAGRNEHALSETKRLQAAQLALEAEERELRGKAADIKFLRNDIQTAQFKAHQAVAMKKFIDDLKLTVEARSNEVLDLEQRAIDREEKAQTSAARREALEGRRADAERTRQRLVDALAARALKREELVQERAAIHAQVEAAEQEMLRFDEVEAQVSAGERALTDAKERGSAEAVAERESQRASHTASIRIIEGSKDRAEDFLLRYEEDAAAIERRFEQFERALAQRRNVIELTHAKRKKLFDERCARATRTIAELKSRRGRFDTVGTQASLRKLEAELEQLQGLVSGQESESERLGQTLKERTQQLAKEEADLMDEKESLKKLVQDTLKVTLEEKRLEAKTLAHGIEVAKLRKKDLAKRRPVLETRLNAAREVLELYQKQIADAERRTKTIKTATD